MALSMMHVAGSMKFPGAWLLRSLMQVAADWALLRGRGVTGAAAVLALGDEGLGCAPRALQLRTSDPNCFSAGLGWECQRSIRATCDLLRRRFTS